MMRYKKNCVYILAFLLYVVTLYVATQWRYTEIDEIYFADAPANFLLQGTWSSHILNSQYSYHPLHGFFLVPWFFLFGISHVTECGFGVFIGFITCLTLLFYSRRLGAIRNKWQEIMLVVGFWAFNTFTDYETFGRPDNLGMLVTVIIIGQLLLDQSRCFIKSFLSGILLISVGMYEIPVVMLFFLIALAKSWSNKDAFKNWFLNGAAMGLGIVCGELLICMFYFFNSGATLPRYLMFTFRSMNHNISSDLSLISRIFDAYLSNIYISVIYVIALLHFCIQKIEFNRINASIILLLPAYMVFVGRFCAYYSWIFYIPMLLFVIDVLAEKKNESLLFITMWTLTSMIYFISQLYVTYGHQTNTLSELAVINKESKEFFERKKNLISMYNTVVLSEEQLYYEVLNTGAEIYFQYRKNIAHKQDFYNYDDMSNSLSTGNRNTDKYLNNKYLAGIVMVYQECNRPRDYFPQSGICIYTCNYEKNTSLKFLEDFGYSYKCLDSDGRFSIYEFSKP